MEQCEFVIWSADGNGNCTREARLFLILPNVFFSASRSKKFWLCLEHYDEMAAFYKSNVASGGDEWDREMVRINGF